MTHERVVKLLVALLSILVTLGAVQLIDDDGDGRPDHVKVPIPKQPVGDLAAPAEDSGDKPAESVLRDETPPGVPPPTLAEGAAEAGVKEDLLRPKEVGGAQNYQVTQDFSGAVYSSRNGAKILNFIVHCTVSNNLPGWGDVYAVRDYFKRTRIASATFIGDFEGHILQMVPRDQKPWTTGWFNPWSETIEIISTCTESRAQWMNSRLIKDGILASLMRDEMRRAGIPIRRVDPIGCNAPLGYFDHAHAECGNFHTDISFGCLTLTGQPTYIGCAFPWEVLAHQLADDPCNKRCRAKRRQKAVVQSRDRKHAETHRDLKRAKCRKRTHSKPLSAYARDECRNLKRRDIRQRKWERKARARYRSL